MSKFLVKLDSSNASLAQGTIISDDFTIKFIEPLYLPGDWEVALIKANLWYAWYNISVDKNNNTFRYFNGSIYQNVTIADGQYTVDQLNDALHRVMKDNGDFTLVGSTEVYDIILEPNFSTLKVSLTLTNSYRLDLATGDLYLLLGADQVEYSFTGTQDFPNIANINDGINDLSIRSSVISQDASFNNDVGTDILYTFVPTSIPGTNINIDPQNKIFLPVRSINEKVKSIRLYLTDNLNRRVDLNDEPMSALLYFRKVQQIIEPDEEK